MNYNDYDHVIVEKGEIDNPSYWNLDVKKKLSHIKKIIKGESCVFPHIDSCLGVIIPLKSGAFVVAHIGRYDLGENNADQVLVKQKNLIYKAIGQKEIPLTVQFFGDISWARTQSSECKESCGLYEMHLDLEEIACQRSTDNPDFDYPFAPDTKNLTGNYTPKNVVINKDGTITITDCIKNKIEDTEKNNATKSKIHQTKFGS